MIDNPENMGRGEGALLLGNVVWILPLKCIHLSDFLLEQVNAFFIRDLFGQVSDPFLRLFQPVNQNPLLLMD